jgi:HK97 family phage major capsid protein
MTPEEIELRRQLHDHVNKARDIHETAARENRNLTQGEQHVYDQAMAQARDIQARVTRGTDLGGFPADGAAAAPGAVGRQVGPAAFEFAGGEPRAQRAPALGMPRAALAEHFPELLAGRYMTEGLPLAVLTSANTGGGAVQVDYTDKAFELRRDMVRIADLCKVDTTDHATIEYMRATAAASAAASVAEGALKPESEPGWTKVNAGAVKVAHQCNVTHEAIEDFPRFAQLVEAEMYAGLLNEENRQLLVGTGGTDLVGLANAPGVLSYAPGSAERRLLSVRKALTLLQSGASFLTGTDSLTLVMHPADAQAVDLTLASGSGEFLADGAPLAGPPGTLWGVRKVVTNRIPAGVSLLGDFKDAATVYWRKPPALLVDPFSQSANNITKIIAEQRMILAVERPASLVRITFNGSE